MIERFGNHIPNFSLISDLFEIGNFFLVDAIPAGSGTDLTDVYWDRADDTHCSLVPSLEGCNSEVLIFGKVEARLCSRSNESSVSSCLSAHRLLHRS